jgi:hypothetical protein
VAVPKPTAKPTAVPSRASAWIVTVPAAVTAAACTVDLFAALNIATGKVIGKLSAQHRAVDFRDSLDQIDRQVDPALTVHVICDNLSTRKAPAVHRWLLAHPRFVLHFTPTYSSWINQVVRHAAACGERKSLEGGWLMPAG